MPSGQSVKTPSAGALATARADCQSYPGPATAGGRLLGWTWAQIHIERYPTEKRLGMFKVTAAAAEQVLRAAKQGGTEGLSLRMAATRRADGSIDYRMGFDEASDDDIRFNTAGIDVVIAPDYVPLLDQTTLDYVEMEPGQYHFIFLNPLDPAYVPPTGQDPE